MEKGDHSSIIYGTHFPNRLFVGCLPPQATADDLGKFFSFYGKVVEAKVVLDDQRRSKRFGFVSFSRPEEAESVLASGDVHLMGKKINVGPAVKKEVKDTSPTVPVKIVTSTPVEETSSVDTFPASQQPARKPKYKYSISNSSLNSDASYHTPPHSPDKGVMVRSPDGQMVRSNEVSPCMQAGQHSRQHPRQRITPPRRQQHHQNETTPPRQHRPPTPPNAILASQLEATTPPKCHSPVQRHEYTTPPQSVHRSPVYQQEPLSRRFDQGLLTTVPHQQHRPEVSHYNVDQLTRDMYNHTISPENMKQQAQHVHYTMEQQQTTQQSPISVSNHMPYTYHHVAPPQYSPPGSPNSSMQSGYPPVHYSTVSHIPSYTLPAQAHCNSYQNQMQQQAQQPPQQVQQPSQQHNQSFFYIPWSSEYNDIPPQSPAFSIQSQYSLPSTTQSQYSVPSTPALPLPYMMMPTFAF